MTVEPATRLATASEQLKWHTAEDKRERRHQDWAQTQMRACERGAEKWFASCSSLASQPAVFALPDSKR